ncbi:MAG: nucleotide exchange factor GrpE, partial [Paramuribaculum sp.]|nr:nucleotide exchange factor GrpE [Paramuribaculum sp.]
NNEPEIIDNIGEAEDENLSDEQIENDEMNEINKLAAELGETKAKLEKEKKEYLFLMAEFDNFRKRTLKEKSEILKNAAENVLKGLLPIVDDFERGLQAADESQDASAIRDGMTLIYNNLVKYLETNGVKAMDTNGADFDPDRHEAIAMVAAGPEQKGKIIDTLTKGYMLNDKVLRHAKVAVGQ